MISLFKKTLGLSHLGVGDMAPDFNLQDQDGNSHSLRESDGRWRVLFFYPKDESHGCTKEVCSFRDEFKAFSSLDTTVYGVSVDSVEDHKNFARNQNLSFPLLADTEKKVCRDYGVLMPVLEIANRVTFLIGPDRKIGAVISWAQWANYAVEVLDKLRALKN
ncbi:MAG: peroxiredoxin [Bdellovibrionota bacterium]